MWITVWSVCKDHLTLKSMNINDNVQRVLRVSKMMLFYFSFKKKKERMNDLACNLRTVVVRKEFRPKSFEWKINDITS